MYELSTLQAAGVGAPILAVAALLSLSLSVWVLRNTREGTPHRFALRTTIAATVVLGVFFALTLSASTASQVGVRAWVAAEHQSEQLVDMFDRATLQLARGRAILRVAAVLVWAPLAANLVALWRAGVRSRPVSAKIPALVLMSALSFATLRVLTSGGGAPRAEAYALIAPVIISDLRRELTPDAQEPTCRRLEGASAIMGVTNVAAELPAARDVARVCVTRRLQTGTSREAIRTSYLLQLAPTALEGL